MKQKLQRSILIFICGAILWFGSCSHGEAAERLPSNSRYILGRLGFGVTTQQMEQVNQQGIEAYLQAQLNPQTVTESPILNQYLAEFEAEQQTPFELQQEIATNNQKIRSLPGSSIDRKEQLQRKITQLKNGTRNSAVEAHLARAIYSHRQLQEVMVDFWFNHFNVFANKGDNQFWIADYENQIRDHALGNFRDLLGVTASHPAMLIYLDNEVNTDPKSSQAKGKFKGLNENYARELMELHTLSVNGGYSQDDIITLAKIFTGWTVDRKGKRGNELGFYFNNQRHDSTPKVFLGQTITAKGKQEGEQALDILAANPATAHFISYKLVQYFVADNPPASLVDTLAQQFLATKGDIKAVMNTLIHSPEFNSPEHQQKFTTPYQYLVSLVRMAEIEQPELKRVQGMLTQLSMPVYGCSAPTGYRNTKDAWLNPEAMLERIAMATAIANNRLNPESSVEYSLLINNLRELSPQTQEAITSNASKSILQKALVLASPEAMYR